MVVPAAAPCKVSAPGFDFDASVPPHNGRPMSHLGHFLQATRNSWKGLVAITRSEKAFQQELVALAIGIPLAFLIATDTWRRVTLIGVLVLLLIVELLNTGLEKLADVIT